MMDAWQSFDFFLPTGISKDAVAVELRERVLAVAADRGDFVRGFRTEHVERSTDDWNRWTVGYLAGPPRIGRFQRKLTALRTGTA